LLEYKEGQLQKIVCEAKGKPKPNVKWLKDGKLIKESKKKVEIDFNPVVDTDMAVYKCVAQNRGGNDEAVTNVTVLCKFFLENFDQYCLIVHYIFIAA
jgi:hypothetical protein